MKSFIEKAREEGIDVNKLHYGQNKVLCPKCINERKNKIDTPLSIEYTNESIAWTCHHCGWVGGLNDKFTPKQDTVKSFIGHIAHKNTISQQALDWLFKRGISEETAKFFKLYTHDQKLCFPYFFNDQIVNVKNRTSDKQFSQTKGGQQTLYNIDNVCVIRTSWI